MEPLFGAAAPPWPAVATPAFGWQPTLGNRQIPNPMAYGAPAIVPPDAFAVFNVPALLAAVAIRRGQPLGPTTDQEIEDFVYDALELLAGTSEVEVRCEGNRVTFTGSVPHKRLKRDVGEIAWAIPSVADVQNNVTIATRRRVRREGDGQQQQQIAKPKER
jgi:hypothetical protein